MTRNFPETSHSERNEDAYESLLTSIEEYQGMLSPIIVSCDDRSSENRLSNVTKPKSTPIFADSESNWESNRV